MKKVIIPIALLILMLGFQGAQAQSSKNINNHEKENKMTAEQNKQVVIRFNNEFFVKGNIEITKELLAETFVNHSAPPNAPTDASFLVKFVTGFRHGFSDVSVQIQEIIAEGNVVSVRKTITATHTGEFMGKQATGKKIVINGMDMEILKDGKIMDHWSMSDFMQVFQSL